MQEGEPKGTLVTHFYESVLKKRELRSLSISFNFLEASSTNNPKEKKVVSTMTSRNEDKMDSTELLRETNTLGSLCVCIPISSLQTGHICHADAC